MRQTHSPPALPRLKTYSAESGYAFEYVFDTETAPGDYRYRVSWDRKNFVAIAVRIDLRLLDDAAARTLSTVERFAVSKMLLRQAFDECVSPENLTATPILPSRDDLTRILEVLDLR